MDSLEWADKPPATSGWYWLDDSEMPSSSPRVVKVRHSYQDDSLIIDDPADGTGIVRQVSDYKGSRWAGPIPQPSDPDT